MTFKLAILGPFIRHGVVWATLAYALGTALQISSLIKRSKLISRNPLATIAAALAIGLFPGGLYPAFIGNNKRVCHAMDKALHVEGSFMAAKMRLIADDVMWPAEDNHNRFYLEMLPRDKWDEFVWSIDDDLLAQGGAIPARWNWARKENQPPEPSFWELSIEDKWKYFKAFWREILRNEPDTFNKAVLEISREYYKKKQEVHILEQNETFPVLQ